MKLISCGLLRFITRSVLLFSIVLLYMQLLNTVCYYSFVYLIRYSWMVPGCMYPSAYLPLTAHSAYQKPDRMPIIIGHARTMLVHRRTPDVRKATYSTKLSTSLLNIQSPPAGVPPALNWMDSVVL